MWNYKDLWVLPLLHKFARIVKRSSSRWYRVCVLYDLRIQCKVAIKNYQRTYCIKMELNLQQNLQNPCHITQGKLRGKVYKDSMHIKLRSDWLAGWLTGCYFKQWWYYWLYNVLWELKNVQVAKTLMEFSIYVMYWNIFKILKFLSTLRRTWSSSCTYILLRASNCPALAPFSGSGQLQTTL